ncbi:MAG: hypothetical protein B6242_03250 [Anaerolineaceae bacterium 4572_78]|nr:MAG: hypothetical protein B6242_03250 [Anaerolineaceae bacterium 4572_78]
MSKALKKPSGFQNRKNLTGLVYIIICIFALTFSLLALNRHATFQTHGFDLGNVNQAIWNTSQGRPFAFTNMAPISNRLVLHVEPILLLFVPFYWLGIGGAKFLLVAQACIVAMGALPLYWLAQTPPLQREGSRSSKSFSNSSHIPALVIILAYLLYPPLESAVMVDFHAITLAPTFLLFAFYYMERQRWTWFALWAVLAMACKENVGLVVMMMGIYHVKANFDAPAGVVIACIGLAWSLIAVFGVQPLVEAGGNIHISRYDWLFQDDATMQIIRHHVWVDVNLLQYLWEMFVGVGGLALFAPITLLPTLPIFALNILSDNPFTWQLIEFHYGVLYAPFVFIATIHGINKICHWVAWNEKNREIFIGTLTTILFACSFLTHYWYGFSPLARPFNWRHATSHHRLGENMATNITDTLPLFAPLNLNPHVSNRRVLHQTFDTITADDWLWLDVASLPNENNIQQHIRDNIMPNYTIIEAMDGYLLLRPKNTPVNMGNIGHKLPDSFYTFAKASAENKPQYPIKVMFGDGLTLIGYDLIHNRTKEIEVMTYWVIEKEVEPITPTLFLIDENGMPLGATDSLPATLVWYPISKWQPNEVVKIYFNRLNWYTQDNLIYNLAIGVSLSPDVWHVGSRLPPIVQETRYANLLFADGTLFQLAHVEHVVTFHEGSPKLQIHVR